MLSIEYKHGKCNLTNSQIYGTEIRAIPAEKFVIPIARVRSVGGY